MPFWAAVPVAVAVKTKKAKPPGDSGIAREPGKADPDKADEGDQLAIRRRDLIFGFN